MKSNKDIDVLSLHQALSLDTISEPQQLPVVLGLVRHIQERIKKSQGAKADVLDAYKISVEVAEDQTTRVSAIIADIAEKIIALMEKGLSKEILLQGLDVGTLIKDVLKFQSDVLTKTEKPISCRIGKPITYSIQQNGREIRSLEISQDLIRQGKIKIAQYIVAAFQQLKTEGFTNCCIVEKKEDMVYAT